MDRFERLRSYLEGNDIAVPSESELEAITLIAIQQDDWENNVGYNVNRIETSPIEKAFHDTWLKWNEPRAGINNGNGILQDLFIDRVDMFKRKWIQEMSHRDRWIVATIIQWLGSNVGMSFLHEVFQQVDMYIASRNKE